MKKIMIVDDELSALNTFLSQIVDDKDIDCKFFKDDIQSAAAYLSENPVDAALLDIRLSETDGVSLAQKLLALSPALKIIFITGYAQNEEEIRRLFPAENLLGFVYKPYDPSRLRAMLSSIEPPKDVFLHTFGRFDLFVNGRAVYFPSTKAKELLALLTDARGAFVSMEKAIDALWQEKNAESGKHLWRDAVYRLRKTLLGEGLDRLVRFERGCACVDTRFAHCDLWDFFADTAEYNGTYMEQYGWSEETEALIERHRCEQNG